MTPRLLLICGLLLAAVPAAAQVPAVDPRLQTLQYDPGKVVRLSVAANFQLTVIFNPEERVENVAIGDSEGWQATVNQRGDTLFLKPVRAGGTTNMTVITDARVYNFELTAIYGPAPDSPFTVRFAYPDAASAEPATAAAPAQTGRYRLGGAQAVRPAAISDDGARTYIEWAADQALPAVFAVDARGREVLLTGYVRDGVYVIDAVHDRLLFRLDRQTARADRSGVEPAA